MSRDHQVKRYRRSDSPEKSEDSDDKYVPYVPIKGNYSKRLQKIIKFT